MAAWFPPHRTGAGATPCSFQFLPGPAMSPSRASWPSAIADEAALEELLSRPSAADVEFARSLEGDVIVLGAGGKMGPSLARRVRRALAEAGVARRVTAVARFSEP